MNEERNKQYEYPEDTNFFTIVTLGIVARLPLETVPQIKKFLNELPQTRLVYQKITPGFLKIVEE